MSGIAWRKSSFSGGMDGNECVELACLGGAIGIRESDDPGTVLPTTPAALAGLIRTVKRGAFGPIIH
jgi:Domain of unknown function (DUF397)